ncbi:unnamed protein product [Prunus armeniaca]
MGGGGGSKKILVGLVVLMLFGVAVYLKLWTIDYTVSSDEAELLRRQFDLANREAMDESAEWRLKYDVEAERATECMNELKQIKGSFEEDDGNAASLNRKLVNLQKVTLFSSTKFNTKIVMMSHNKSYNQAVKRG